MSAWLAKSLGNWAVCALFGLIATVMFTYIVPNGVAEVTANRTLAPKILDEYFLTWSPDDARQLYAALGAGGRHAYQQFYLKLDFWFPVLSLSVFYCSLLSLAFPTGSRLGRLNLLPIILYASDAAENLNHFSMATSYPDLPDLQLTVGPVLSAVKYGLVTALPSIALLGFILRRKSPTTG